MALVIALAVSVLLWLVLLLIPHLILTTLSSVPRSARVALSTVWVAGATVGLLIAAVRASTERRASS